MAVRSANTCSVVGQRAIDARPPCTAISLSSRFFTSDVEFCNVQSAVRSCDDRKSTRAKPGSRRPVQRAASYRRAGQLAAAGRRACGERIIEALCAAGDTEGLVMHVNMTAVLQSRPGQARQSDECGIASEGGRLFRHALPRRLGIRRRLRHAGEQARTASLRWLRGSPFDEPVFSGNALACVRHVEVSRARATA